MNTIGSLGYPNTTTVSAKFHENKSQPYGEISQSFTYVCKSCPSHDFLTLQILLLTLFKKKILVKISEFTVLQLKQCNSHTMGCPPVRGDYLMYRWTNMV